MFEINAAIKDSQGDEKEEEKEEDNERNDEEWNQTTGPSYCAPTLFSTNGTHITK